MTESAEKRPKTIDSVFSISHDKDVDGLTSAAIVWRYALSKGHDFSVVLTDYGTFDHAFSKVTTCKNSLIIITDLGMDESSLDEVVSNISKALAQNCRIVWIDHHQWSERSKKAILGLRNKPILRVNHEYCAAEITHKVLMPRDEISAELAKLAHDADFNLRQIDAAMALTDALSVIRFGAMDRKEDITAAIMPLLSKLAKHGIEGVWDDKSKRFKDSLLQKQVSFYRKDKVKKMKKALKGQSDHEIDGRLVRIIEIPSGVTTTDMGTYLSKPENLKVEGKTLEVADLLITLSQGGMLGFRRGKETVLCNEAAKIFNGGGHPYAAGGEYGVYDDFQAVCDDIFLTLSQNRDWLIK